jgi:glycosyltransferase involved in cell wall biosynthesis
MPALSLDKEALLKERGRRFAAIAIGRNEGERLKRCLKSVSGAAMILYVDSGSTDGSVQWAREQGVDVIELDMSIPFTAARARNAGFWRLREVAPNIRYVQFIDGDCELNGAWPKEAIDFLETQGEFAAVCGRRRELYPEQSIYNWLCDVEWNVPAGDVRVFTGDVMARASAIAIVGGYRDDLIAGEEPELSVRLREAGWRIWRLASEMTMHDAAMTCFSQWWNRAVRAGYAFAQGAYLHRESPERHWVWESRRAWLWGVLLPVVCVVLSVRLWPWGPLVWLIYPLQFLRQMARNPGSLSDRATLAFFQLFARFPESLGQLTFLVDRLFGTQTRLLEYK